LGIETVGKTSGVVWEQIDLPRRASSGVLVNLGNAAPVFARRQLIVIHDTATMSFPAAYSWKFRAWTRMMQRAVLRMGARVVTVSEFARQEISKHLGVPLKSICVIGEGADHMARMTPDPTVLARFHLKPGGFVLAVGNLAAHKNIAVLGATAKALAAMDIEMVVAGADNKALFRNGGIIPPEPARYIGRVTDEELRALYEAARCFVFPSLYEGFGLPAVEAMACGCPVVVSDLPVFREVCGDAACYVDPQSGQAVAAGVCALALDDTRATCLRYAGLAQIHELTWERSAATLMPLLRDLVL
jgi:glycosyltransferase involved in cell wall biosynthesis